MEKWKIVPLCQVESNDKKKVLHCLDLHCIIPGWVWEVACDGSLFLSFFRCRRGEAVHLRVLRATPRQRHRPGAARRATRIVTFSVRDAAAAFTIYFCVCEAVVCGYIHDPSSTLLLMNVNLCDVVPHTFLMFCRMCTFF